MRKSEGKKLISVLLAALLTAAAFFAALHSDIPEIGRTAGEICLYEQGSSRDSIPASPRRLSPVLGTRTAGIALPEIRFCERTVITNRPVRLPGRKGRPAPAAAAAVLSSLMAAMVLFVWLCVIQKTPDFLHQRILTYIERSDGMRHPFSLK